MIELRKVNGLQYDKVYVHPDQLLSVEPAGPNGQGIRSYAKLTDGRTLCLVDDATSVAEQWRALRPQG